VGPDGAAGGWRGVASPSLLATDDVALHLQTQVVTGEAGRTHDTQRELVERAREGDETAFASLVPEAAERLLAVAYRILRDAALAEDATQQAIVDAWRHLPELRDPARFEAWTYRLAVRACYKELRRHRGRLHAPLRLLGSHEPRSPDEASTVIARDRIDRGFRRLSPEHRAVLVLHHYVGLPLVEIARTLDLPVGTVRSRLHYASRALRASIEADEAHPAPRGML
jgi:RNA polymerase sigma-70 factor, ECF subfamily